MEKQAIIEKIRKLTALAERAGTEAEARAALERTEILLTKYNLSLADVSAAEDSDCYDEHEICRDSTANKWLVYMTPSIADIYFCMPLLRKNGRTTTMTLIGRSENVQACLYIIGCVRAAGNKAAKRFKADAFGTISDHDIRDFKRAFALRIAARCRDILDASEKRDVPTGTSCVTVVDYRKDEKERLAALSGCSATSRRRTARIGNTAAAAHGMQAAETVSLGRDTIRSGVGKAFKVLPFFKS